MTLEDRLRRLERLVVVLLIALTVTWALLGYVIYTGRHNQAHRNDALHSVLCFAEQAQLANTHLTPREHRVSVEFWTNELVRAHLSPC